MLMSIFSPFEALCAEYFGQKLGLSWAPAPSNTQDAAVDAAGIGDLKKGEEVKSSSRPRKTAEDRRRTRAPRFAPELDGVNCFETILPY